jgi:hypothetical protein
VLYVVTASKCEDKMKEFEKKEPMIFRRLFDGLCVLLIPVTGSNETSGLLTATTSMTKRPVDPAEGARTKLYSVQICLLGCTAV